MASWTRSPNPSILYQTQIVIDHTSNKENFNQSHVCSFFLPLKLFLLLPYVIHFSACYFLLEMIPINFSVEVGVYCSQQAVDGWSHSAEHIEQPMVLSISVASFVVVQCGVTGYSLHIDSASSCHVTNMCCALPGEYFYHLSSILRIYRVKRVDFKSIHIHHSAFLTVMAAKRSRL